MHQIESHAEEDIAVAPHAAMHFMDIDYQGDLGKTSLYFLFNLIIVFLLILSPLP